MKKRVFLLILLMVLCWTGLARAGNKVVLFVMDGVNWQEIQQVETPNYDQLVVSGAVGLMNAKTAGSLEPVDTYLTIGSGDYARGANKAGRLSFNRNERWQGTAIEDIYKRRIGHLDESATIANIQLAQLKRANQSSSYQAQVGQLGTSLAAEGLRLTVLGNADTANKYRRQIALLGINEYGTINQGDIGHQTTKMVNQYPSSYLTNKSYLMDQFNKYYNQSDLLIVESGFTSRIEAVKSDLLAAKFKERKREAIKQADGLLGAIKQQLDFKSDYLIVVAPTPAQEYIKEGYKLSWTLVEGPTINSGLLTTGTTKQEGLITNLDLLPTIYSYLVDNNDHQFVGQGITTISRDNNIDYLNNLNEQIKTIFAWRPVVVKQFIVLQIIILSLIGFNLLTKNRLVAAKNWIIYAVLTVNWLPVFFIFSIFFVNLTLMTTIFFWLASSLLLAYLTYKIDLKKPLVGLIIPNLLIAGTLIIDLWTNAQLLKVSILGYSPVVGARYYGIGNEYMGLLIGTTIVVITLFFEIRSRIYNKLAVVSFLLLIITIGAPSLGANFGGLISSSLISVLTYFYLHDYNLNFIAVLKVLLSVVLIVSIMIFFDINSATKSHLSRVIVRIGESGWQELVKIIYRKLAINLRLLQWTIWTKVLLAFVFVLVVLFKHPQGITAKLVAEYPYFSAGFKALLWGSFVAGAVNDSGVVVVATLLLVPVFVLIYLVFSERLLEKEGN
ncbi:MAG: hypothetical protein ACQEP9_04185 [Bacillota bacterium]